MSPAKAVRFHFDYISHNAYLAWTQLAPLAARYGYDVEPVPVLFAGLLGAHGQRGPAEVLPKAVWMGKNLLRKAALLGVPLNPPAFHPFNPLLALRASGVPSEVAARRTLVDALFRAVWVDGQHVSEPAVVERVATAAGFDGPAIVAAANAPEAKARLRRDTDAAIASMVFGVPSMAIGDEVFWGYDDFPYLELFLAGKDPLDQKRWREWIGGVRPSAMRKEVLGPRSCSPRCSLPRRLGPRSPSPSAAPTRSTRSAARPSLPAPPSPPTTSPSSAGRSGSGAAARSRAAP